MNIQTLHDDSTLPLRIPVARPPGGGQFSQIVKKLSLVWPPFLNRIFEPYDDLLAMSPISKSWNFMYKLSESVENRA